MADEKQSVTLSADVPLAVLKRVSPVITRWLALLAIASMGSVQIYDHAWPKPVPLIDPPPVVVAAPDQWQALVNQMQKANDKLDTQSTTLNEHSTQLSAIIQQNADIERRVERIEKHEDDDRARKTVDKVNYEQP